MPTNSIMYRRLYTLGIGAYVIMLFFSILFYKERIIILDTADMLFYIAQSGSFSVYASRCGALVTQILPLLSVKLGLSLNAIMVSYSINFTLYYFACYLVCGSVLKRYELALVMLLGHILFVTDTFYYIPSELPQGVDFLLVAFAWISRIGADGSTRSANVPLVLALACCFAAAFFHPLVLFVLVFIILFFALRKDVLIPGRVYVAVIAVFCSGLAVKALFFSIPYDRHAASGIKNFITLFPHYFDLYSNKLFLHHCITKYYWIPILTIVISVVYAIQQEWRKAGLFLFFIIGYVLLVNVSYPTSATPLLYFENQYLPLGFFLALPFVYDVLPRLGNVKMAVAALSLIILTGCLRFYTMHDKYAARLNWERNFLSANGDKKLIAKATKADEQTLLMLWGTPYEFWLLSTSEQNKTASIIIDADPWQRGWATEKRNSFVVNWNMYRYKDLNPRYFHFADTTTAYIVER